ncbi:unnamed protein product, partial [Nesidiocoris tenuis]
MNFIPAISYSMDTFSILQHEKPDPFLSHGKRQVRGNSRLCRSCTQWVRCRMEQVTEIVSSDAYLSRHPRTPGPRDRRKDLIQGMGTLSHRTCTWTQLMGSMTSISRFEAIVLPSSKQL